MDGHDEEDDGECDYEDDDTADDEAMIMSTASSASPAGLGTSCNRAPSGAPQWPKNRK